MPSGNKEDGLILEILQNIEEDGDLTQRRLSENLGVALGLTNSYLKRCMRKGLVKIRLAPSNRYFYYLTPRGFAEKSRLTARFLATSFEMYRRASRDYRDVMQQCRDHYAGGIVLLGNSELAEIALLRAQEAGVRVFGVFDPGSRETRFVSLPVFRENDFPAGAEAAVLTLLHDESGLLERYRRTAGRVPLLVPRFLAHAPGLSGAGGETA